MQNEVINAQSFFSSMRTIPTLGFTMQNIFTSMGVLFVSFSGLVFTATIVLPLSIVRCIVPEKLLTKVPGDAVMRKKGKVVLIIGASRGIGMEVLKQYASEEGTTIIAVAKDGGALNMSLLPLSAHAHLLRTPRPPSRSDFRPSQY